MQKEYINEIKKDGEFKIDACYLCRNFHSYISGCFAIDSCTLLNKKIYGNVKKIQKDCPLETWEV